MRIAVTGAGGFIGSALVSRLHAQGHRVIGMDRADPDLDCMEFRQYDLSAQLSGDALAGVDLVVHCAYQIGAGKNERSVNEHGTRQLEQAARARGASCVFISSFSATEDAESTYGKTKRALEPLFSRAGDAVVRPGLVLGNGGLFARIASQIRLRRPLPLIGNPPLQTVLIDDLVESIVRIVEGRLDGAFDLAETTPVSFEALYREMARRMDLRPFMVRVPLNLALLLVRTASAVYPNLPVDEDRLLGLKHMRARDTRAAAARLGMSFRTMNESLEALAHSPVLLNPVGVLR